MKILDFPGRNIVYAEDQPEYLPLPALRLGNAEGEIICCWGLTWRERLRLLLTGRIWHSVFTFHQPLQPQLLTIEKPDAIVLAEAKEPQQ